MEATNAELYQRIEMLAQTKIPDSMRREAFLMNAHRAMRQNNREYLLRYLYRLEPPVRGGRLIYFFQR